MEWLFVYDVSATKVKELAKMDPIVNTLPQVCIIDVPSARAPAGKRHPS